MYIYIYTQYKSEVNQSRDVNDCRSPTCITLTEKMLDLMDNVSIPIYVYISSYDHI